MSLQAHAEAMKETSESSHESTHEPHTHESKQPRPKTKPLTPVDLNAKESSRGTTSSFKKKIPDTSEPSDGNMSIKQKALLLYNQAVQLDNNGFIAKAMDCYLQSLHLKNQAVSNDAPHSCVGLTLYKIGVLHWKRGSYQEALQTLQSALNVYRRCSSCCACQEDVQLNSSATKPTVEDLICHAVQRIGSVYLSLGDFDRSLELYKKCLARSVQSHGGTNHPDIARTMILIGAAYDEKGEYAKAKKQYRDGLAIQLKVFGEQHVNVAETLNRIGVIHEKFGNIDKAMQHYTDALSTYRNCLSSKHSHVDIGVTLNNIGQIHRLKGNYKEAMKVYQESFRIMKSILGLEHRNVAASLHNMATIFVCQEEYDKATELFRNVLIVQRGALGDDHLDVAITLDSMGHVYERRKKFDKAFKLYSKSLRVRKAALGKHHLFVAVSADRIANFLRESGHDSMEALRHFNEALEVYVANDFEESHPELVGVKRHIATLQKKSSDSKQAEHAAVAVA